MEGRNVNKVVATRPLTDEQVEIISQVIPGDRLVAVDSREALIAEVAGATVLFAVWGGVDLDAGILAAARSLEWVHIGSTGVEHVLIPELAGSSIVVTNSSAVHAAPVAEHAFALVLSLAKNIYKYERHRLERKWDRLAAEPLQGATLGVVGFGSIGRRVAAAGRAFGMNVLAVRGRAGAPDAGDLAARVVGRQGLHEVLRQADFVVVSVPLTGETRGMIGRREFDAMKKGSYLVNVSRGGVIDEKALAGALESGWLRGAALDVFEREPLAPDSPLWGLDNLIITPHVAGKRPDHFQAVARHFAENLRRWISGEELLNVVDKQRGY